MLVRGSIERASREPSRDEQDEVLDWVARQGFEALELSDRWLPLERVDSWLELRDRAACVGVDVCSVTVFRRMPVAAEAARRDRSALERAVDVAGRLGGAVVAVAIAQPETDRPWVPLADQHYAELVRFLVELADRAEEQNTIIALELHDDGPFDQADSLVQAVVDVGRHNVGVNPDLGNLVRNRDGWDWRDALGQLAPHAVHWHVKNYRHGVQVPLTDGIIEYREALRLLRAARYRGAIVPETRFGRSPLDCAAAAAQFLRASFAGEGRINL